MTTIGADGLVRCPWGVSTPDYVAYHDEEWGRPVRDDRGLYERLTLEAFQSGLSWLTILRKRPGFRRAFDDFAPEKVAAASPGAGLVVLAVLIMFALVVGATILIPVLIVLGIAMIVGMGGVFYWASRTTYAPLMGNLAPEDSTAIIRYLREKRIPFVVDESGRSISVPPACSDQ